MYYDPEALGLEVISLHGVEALVVCPYHDDEHPSANFNMKKGVLFCFSCGASAYAPQIARHLGGKVHKLGVETFGRYYKVTDSPPPNWEWFNSLPSAISSVYLAGRGVSNKMIEEYDIRSAPNAIVFPMHRLSGELVGYQLRKTDPEAMPRYLYRGPSLLGWPLRCLPEYDYSNYIYLVEGIFGAVRGLQGGYQTFSLMGSSKINEKLTLLLGPFEDRVRVLFDDDNAGYNGAKKLVKLFKGNAAAILPGGEADEMSIEEWGRLLDWSTVTSNSSEIQKYLK